MKKKILIIGGSVVVIVIAVTSYLFAYRNDRINTHNNENTNKKILNKETCKVLTGGSFNLIFNTNGGNEIGSMHVGIAVSPDSYQDLPTPEKGGFTFEGWYYDSELGNKVDAASSKDIEPIPVYDSNKCMTGYEDITLYAKWNEIVNNDTREETSNSSYEVLENVQVDVPASIEEQSIPEDQMVEETIPATCEFKRPVGHGKFVDYQRASGHSLGYKHDYFVVTDRLAQAYSVTCGRVYYIRSYRSAFNYRTDGSTPELVYEIYTFSKLNGEVISIVYSEVAEITVKVGDIVSSDSVIGRAAYMSKGVFVHSLPYIKFYIQKGETNPINSSNGASIYPTSLIPMSSEEFWNDR